jgi:hypothetical protein
MKCTEMEAAAGLDFSLTNAENFPVRGSLIHFPKKLRSLLWAVIRNRFRRARSPPVGKIGSAVQTFRHAADEGRAANRAYGAAKFSRDLAGSRSDAR